MIAERLLNETASPWWGEHVQRYDEVTARLSKNSKVLDIACGTGFGSMKLAQQSMHVTGGDISTDAIEYCKSNHQHELLGFQVMDGTQLPFKNKHFDAIVSFETIEHTVHYDKMLQEFARTLKPEGYAYISTPNILINSPSGVVTNPFHTQEWKYEELIPILQKHFRNIEFYGQEYTRYKDANGNVKVSISRVVENILYKRGFRKIPISIQDLIMKLAGSKQMYPLPEDYRMTDDINRIKKCLTFFAICRP